MSKQNLADLVLNEWGGRISDRVRAMARENVLSRLADEEAVVVATAALGEVDAKIAELRAQLPGLAEREVTPKATIKELQEQVIDLTAQRARCELDNDGRGAIRAGEAIALVERQIAEFQAELTTCHNRRADIEYKVTTLEAARRELAPLAHG